MSGICSFEFYSLKIGDESRASPVRLADLKVHRIRKWLMESGNRVNRVNRMWMNFIRIHYLLGDNLVMIVFVRIV